MTFPGVHQLGVWLADALATCVVHIVGLVLRVMGEDDAL